MSRLFRIGILVFFLIFIPLWAATSGGNTPINDLGTGTYLGFEGGLYPNGSNTLPPSHASAGNSAAISILPRAVDGSPHPNGKYVFLSVGMSNANQEFCGNSTDGVSCNSWTFMGQADNPLVNDTTLTMVNGAAGGQVADTWDSPDDPNYNRIRDELLAPLGLSENQVQVVWLKVAHPNPTHSLPDSNADAYRLLIAMGKIVRSLNERYPHLQQVYVSSRIYAGYATSPLNPEPFAYESGFAVKWLIEAQIDQVNGGGIDPHAGDLSYAVAPWLAWGPYTWADGTTPRSDGLIWELADYQEDGTHPSESGETKVGTMLLDFFLNSPQTMCWFRAGQTCAFEPSDFLFLPIVLSP